MDKFDPQAAESDISSAVQLILNIDGLSDFTTAEARKHEDDPSKNPLKSPGWISPLFSKQHELWDQRVSLP